MINALFNVLLLVIFVVLMFWCYEAWQPKPYPKSHMMDFAKRLGKK